MKLIPVLVLLLVVAPEFIAANACDDGDGCQNRAQCKFNRFTYQVYCDCHPGYTGDQCQIVEPFTCLDAGEGCYNNGTCRWDPAAETYVCHCQPGYTDYLCYRSTTQDGCSMPGRCGNGGSCANVGNTSVCTCAPGWSGTYCRTRLEDCNSARLRCRNGGTCRSSVCECAPGWGGPDCSTRQDACAFLGNLYCVNGVCANNNRTSVFCRCDPGWGGMDCSIREPARRRLVSARGRSQHPASRSGMRERERSQDACTSGQLRCQNGGTCASTVCRCVPGWGGPDCSKPSCEPSPCVRGRCKIRKRNNKLKCRCPKLWTGKHCDRPRKTKTSSRD